MKVQCGQCPAKYAVADERIRDKKVRIHCRRCNAAIVVDGKVTPPLVTSTPARRSARPLSSTPAPESVPPSTPEPELRQTPPRAVAHTIMGGLEAPVARQLVTDHVAQSQGSPSPRPVREIRPGTLEGTGELLDPRPGMPEPSRGFTDPPAKGDAERWRVALTQQDLRWMTTEEITLAFRDGAVKSETFVFRAGMPTWVTLLEVSEIAQALSDAQLVSAPLQPLHLDESDARPSSPPRRLSSLPPPRKAIRTRSGSAGGEPDGPSAPGEGASDSEESLPFALVPQRVNGAKKPADAPAAEVAPNEPAEHAAAAADPASGDAASPDAASPDAASPDAASADAASPDAASDAAAPDAASPDAAAPDAAGVATPLVPAAAEALANGTAPNAFFPAGTAVASPLEPVPAATAAPPKRSSGTWIWLVLALLLAAGAALFFGPRFGLHLH